MPTTPFIKAIEYNSEDSISVTNPLNTLQGSSGESIMGPPPSALFIKFPSFNLPYAATITDIHVDISLQTVQEGFIPIIPQTIAVVQSLVKISNPEVDSLTLSLDNFLLSDDFSAQTISPTFNSSNVDGFSSNDAIQKLASNDATVELQLTYQSFPPSANPSNLVKILSSYDSSPGISITYDVPAFDTDPLFITPKVKIQENTKVKLTETLVVNEAENVPLKGPKSAAEIGTGLGDGVYYVLPASPFPATNILEIGGDISSYNPGTNFNFTFLTLSDNVGIRLSNIFNAADFPDANNNFAIVGAEIIAGQNFDGTSNYSSIQSFGGNDLTATFDVECYFFDGEAYSPRLTWDSTFFDEDITYLNNNQTARFTGKNTHYKNNTAGDDVLFGSPNNTFGLNWSLSNVLDFGFAIACVGRSGSPVQGGFRRGLGMKIYYATTEFQQIKTTIKQIPIEY